MPTRRSPLEMRAHAARSLAAEAVNAGSGVVENTREFAAQALERAAQAMRDLRYGVADTTQAAQRQVGRYVAEQPLKSALLAAAVGALVMAAILASRRRAGRY